MRRRRILPLDCLGAKSNWRSWAARGTSSSRSPEAWFRQIPSEKESPLISNSEAVRDADSSSSLGHFHWRISTPPCLDIGTELSSGTEGGKLGRNGWPCLPSTIFPE